MSKGAYTRLFRNPEVRAEMLNLWTRGYSCSKLSRKYNCDRASIIYQCQKAGLALKQDVRNKLFALIKQGFTPEKVAEELNLTITVVKLYYDWYPNKKAKLFNQTKLQIIGDVVINPKDIIIRVDDRGVEWRDDGRGGWICMGMSIKNQRQKAVEKKKKELEKKRADLLIY